MARVKYSTKGHQQRSLVKKTAIIQGERAQVARSAIPSPRYDLRPRRNGRVVDANLLALLLASPSPSPDPDWMPEDRIPARRSKKKFGDESGEDLAKLEGELRAEFTLIAENPRRIRQGKGFLKNSVNQSLWKSIEPKDPNVNALPERFVRSQSPGPASPSISGSDRDDPSPPPRRMRAKTPFPGRDDGSISPRPSISPIMPAPVPGLDNGSILPPTSISPITPPPAPSPSHSIGKNGNKRQREDDEEDEEGDWGEFEREMMAELARESSEDETRMTKKARR